MTNIRTETLGRYLAQRPEIQAQPSILWAAALDARIAIDEAMTIDRERIYHRLHENGIDYDGIWEIVNDKELLW